MAKPTLITRVGPPPTLNEHLATKKYVDDKTIGVGVFTKLGSDVLTGAGDLLTLSFTATARIKIIFRIINSGQINLKIQVNGITTSTYDAGRVKNGAFTSATAKDGMEVTSSLSENMIGELIIISDANAPKQLTGKIATGTVTVFDVMGQEDASALVDQIDIINTGSGDFDANSRMDVYKID